MELLLGTNEGLYRVGHDGAATTVKDLAGHTIWQVARAGDALLAGSDDGVFRSGDGGRTWRHSGVKGVRVWDIASSPDNPRRVYAGTQPAHLFRSDDGGESWSEIDGMSRVPGAQTWLVPSDPKGARARTIVLDRVNPDRFWVGIEVGGVVSSRDDGRTCELSLPGGNPDIHIMVGHPAKEGVLFATTGFGRIDNSEPWEKRIAGLFGSWDGGRSWSYLWHGVEPRYTRPISIDPRAPYALTVGTSPKPSSSYKDEGGAGAMLYRSDDEGKSWRSLGDAAHSPSPAQIWSITPDPAIAGAVLVGTDLGEVWRVTAAAEWTLLADSLPMVQMIAAVG